MQNKYLTTAVEARTARSFNFLGAYDKADALMKNINFKKF